MTLKELLDLIKVKRESAIRDYSQKKCTELKAELKGEIDAYTDVICLIEGSEVKEDEV